MTPKLRKILFLASIVWLCLFMAGCSENAPQILTQVETIIAGLLPIIGAAAAALLPAEAAALSSGVALVTAGLKALQRTVKSYQANPTDTTLQKVSDAFAAVQANLNDLEQAAQVKDAATQKKIGSIVTAVNLSLASLESIIQANHPATVAAAAPTGA